VRILPQQYLPGNVATVCYGKRSNVVIGELAVFASCGPGCQVLGWPNGAEARERSKSWR
jgi:hypothetical protein